MENKVFVDEASPLESYATSKVSILVGTLNSSNVQSVLMLVVLLQVKGEVFMLLVLEGWYVIHMNNKLGVVMRKEVAFGFCKYHSEGGFAACMDSLYKPRLF